jgi:peroxiredoxin
MKNDHLTPRDAPISVGETAPDFTLLNQDREEVSLKGLLERGGDVVLSFYPLNFTSVCTSEMECFTNDKSKFEKEGATVVGISCDSFASHKAFAEQSKLDMPLLADMHRHVCKAYGFYWPDLNVASRGTVVINADGVVTWVSSREPGDAVKNEDVLAAVS